MESDEALSAAEELWVLLKESKEREASLQSKVEKLERENRELVEDVDQLEEALELTGAENHALAIELDSMKNHTLDLEELQERYLCTIKTLKRKAQQVESKFVESETIKNKALKECECLQQILENRDMDFEKEVTARCSKLTHLLEEHLLSYEESSLFESETPRVTSKAKSSKKTKKQKVSFEEKQNNQQTEPKETKLLEKVDAATCENIPDESEYRVEDILLDVWCVKKPGSLQPRKHFTRPIKLNTSSILMEHNGVPPGTICSPPSSSSSQKAPRWHSKIDWK